MTNDPTAGQGDSAGASRHQSLAGHIRTIGEVIKVRTGCPVAARVAAGIVGLDH